MENSIENIIDIMLDEAKARQNRNKGGMEEYINTLQDSDTFYEEAFSDGEVTALENVFKRVRSVIEHNQNVTAKQQKQTIRLILRTESDFQKAKSTIKNPRFYIDDVFGTGEKIEVYAANDEYLKSYFEYGGTWTYDSSHDDVLKSLTGAY
ncbi:MAG: hypothetical protein COB67_02300 [SAR324 cluster bacterium]|uniref:Uncharacterized protein n=1 Tax=SAR324 cluster bacterium TaxID=2024889 RepID=A0A2A4TAY2_9DELT|nr:MAG: hypothetical protein COB67_02300 [SAR324 cluster bacterium]